MNIFIKIILFVCGVFLFFFPQIKPKVKKHRKVIYFFAVLAIAIPIFVPAPKKQDVVTVKLSEEEITKIVDQLAEVIKPYLDKKYTPGSVYYGVYRQKIIKPKHPTTGPLVVNWKGASATQLIGGRIALLIPHIKFQKANFYNPEFILPMKKNARICPVKKGEYKLCVEIVDIVRDIIIVGVGIKKDQS